jgi:phosphohistidine phosphatase SixA
MNPGRASVQQRWLAFFLLAIATFASAPFAHAQEGAQELVPRMAPGPLMDALREGGYTILLRHTATQAFNPDLTTYDPDDCTTQRNLSELGRHQAEQIGESFRKLGIKVGQVLSSPYCRCMDTGSLAFGADAVETSTTLLVGASKSGSGRDDPGIAIRKLLDTAPEAGANTVLIAHSVTLLYAFGLTSRPEGVAHVFQPTQLGLGRPDYIGMVKPEEWPAHAGLAAGAPAVAPPESH